MKSRKEKIEMILVGIAIILLAIFLPYGLNTNFSYEYFKIICDSPEITCIIDDFSPDPLLITLTILIPILATLGFLVLFYPFKKKQKQEVIEIDDKTQ